MRCIIQCLKCLGNGGADFADGKFDDGSVSLNDLIHKHSSFAGLVPNDSKIAQGKMDVNILWSV